jgi:hypothetical protein
MRNDADAGTNAFVLVGKGSRPGSSFAVEMQLDQAVLVFEWQFDELPGHRTKLTQQIVLPGDNAGAYAAQVEAGFGPNLPDGTRRIVAEMAATERSAPCRAEASCRAPETRAILRS